MTEFESFLSYFPEIEPPVTLTDESIDHINATNDPLPYSFIEKYVKVWDNAEDDEFTEYVPCLKLPGFEKIHCIIYWKAALLKYDFFLVTTDLKGELIARKSICGTTIEGDIIKKSVALINEEYQINIMAGAHHTSETGYNASNSQLFAMEIMPNGEIVFMKEA